MFVIWPVVYPNSSYVQDTVVLKGNNQKKNVSNNPSMDSFSKIYIDSEKLWPKIQEWDLFELTLQNNAKKP